MMNFAHILLVSYFIVRVIAVACLRVDVTIRDLFPFQLSISEQNVYLSREMGGYIQKNVKETAAQFREMGAYVYRDGWL
jgi:hypothetical protein